MKKKLSKVLFDLSLIFISAASPVLATNSATPTATPSAALPETGILTPTLAVLGIGLTLAILPSLRKLVFKEEKT